MQEPNDEEPSGSSSRKKINRSLEEAVRSAAQGRFDGSARQVVEVVKDANNEITLADAKEIAGDEVELGNVIVRPVSNEPPPSRGA